VFLTKDGRAKLGDLNVSKIAKKGLLYTQTGTPYYASPEVWKDLPYDTKSDIWSLGCVVYEAVCLKPPFRAQSMEALNKVVQKGIYPKIPSIYSEDIANFIKVMLQINPKKRPSCEEILKLTIIKKKIEELDLDEDGSEKQCLMGSQLLGTIQVPKNLKVLRDKLPKPNYRKQIEEEESEGNTTLPHVVPRNKSTKSNKSGLHLIDPEVILNNGNMGSAHRASVEQKLKNVIKASHQVIPKNDIQPSDLYPIKPVEVAPVKYEQIFEESESKPTVKLPDIRRAAAPIKRPAPRVYANNNNAIPIKNVGDLADIYLQPQVKKVGPDIVRQSPSYVERSEGQNDRNARLKRIYEEINKHKAGYYALPQEKVKAPIVQNVYHNAYHIYQSPLIVRPSWWG